MDMIFGSRWPLFLGILMSLPWRAEVNAQTGPDSSAVDKADYVKGLALQRQNEFDSAVIFYKRFRETFGPRLETQSRLMEVDKRIRECESGQKLIRDPRKFIITNLGQTINSPYADYAPLLSEDESLLVFTTRRPAGNFSPQKTEEGSYFEDIFFSRRRDETWLPAKNIGSPVNTRFHDSDLALSSDGNILYLYTDENEGDILVSGSMNGKWGKPRPLPPPLNSPYHESSLSVSGNGDKIFIASERPGGLGGSDIYLVEKDSRGQWGNAINLGPVVNTEWDEDSPFIDYDGATLYFSSTGHNSMGGYDIFRSRKQGGHWSSAENLGFPINTALDDSYFVSTKDGKRAYYSSVQKGGYGGEDIYLITLPPELTREDVEKIETVIERPAVSSILIYFPFGSDQPGQEQQLRLDEFMDKLIMNKQSLIYIDGHTDSVGSDAFNQKLSLDRAMTIGNLLKKRGVPAGRLFIKGWGAERPVISNGEEKEGRALNRRVEIRVIYD